MGVYCLACDVPPLLDCVSSIRLSFSVHHIVEVVFIVLFLSLREFTLDASVEMPHEISSLLCTTHKVKIKVIFHT